MQLKIAAYHHVLELQLCFFMYLLYNNLFFKNPKKILKEKSIFQIPFIHMILHW